MGPIFCRPIQGGVKTIRYIDGERAVIHQTYSEVWGAVPFDRDQLQLDLDIPIYHKP